MSAGDRALVQMASVSDFNSMANDIRGMEKGYTTTFIIDGEITQGWVLVDTDPPFQQGNYYIVFRHPIDDRVGTAEYIGVLLSDDGRVTEVRQYVLLQNDNDYQDSDFERFGALWLEHTH